MRRVLHPITRLIVGGAQENTLLTARGLRGRWEVEVLTGPQAGPEGSLLEEARRHGLRVRVLPQLVREIAPWSDLRALAALARTCRGFDVVHTHSSKAGLLGRLAGRLARVPAVVHTVHGWPFHERMSAGAHRLYVLAERLAARWCDALVVVTTRDRDKGLAHGIGRPDQYHLVRSGIELDRFGATSHLRLEVRRSLGIPEDALVVGSVTRLSEQKAPLDLVEAFRRLQVPAWLVIVGDGALRPRVEEALRGTERAILTGLRRDIPELMSAFDVFALSSLWEGLPRVLPQAMACGLPIVCTAVDGSVEAVEDGRQGFLTAPGRPEELAARLDDLLRDPELRERMGRAGRERAPEFSAKRMVADLEALYLRLLSSS